MQWKYRYSVSANTKNTVIVLQGKWYQCIYTFIVTWTSFHDIYPYSNFSPLNRLICSGPMWADRCWKWAVRVFALLNHMQDLQGFQSNEKDLKKSNEQTPSSLQFRVMLIGYFSMKKSYSAMLGIKTLQHEDHSHTQNTYTHSTKWEDKSLLSREGFISTQTLIAGAHWPMRHVTTTKWVANVCVSVWTCIHNNINY